MRRRIRDAILHVVPHLSISFLLLIYIKHEFILISTCHVIDLRQRYGRKYMHFERSSPSRVSPSFFEIVIGALFKHPTPKICIKTQNGTWVCRFGVVYLFHLFYFISFISSGSIYFVRGFAGRCGCLETQHNS